MDKWKIFLEKKPMQIKGQHINGGEILMDKSVRKFASDCNTNEFDRNIQNRMF